MLQKAPYGDIDLAETEYKKAPSNNSTSDYHYRIDTVVLEILHK